ncbi:MAG: GNAT family N-acetyltransferase [Afipia sp.]
MISVTVCSPDADISAQWDDLVRRASPNVFMNPAALKAAADALFAVVHVLLAWDMAIEPPRLVGLWGLQARNIFPFGPALLEALPYDYAFLSSPVIDHAFAGEVIPAFLAFIRSDKSLPGVLSIKEMNGEDQACAAIRATVAAGGLACQVHDEGERPVVSREFGVKASGSTRKKLRQDWNRLAALGALDVVNERQAVGDAFETFLRLEFASWKGAEGTALLCDDRDAAFVRRLIGNLAERGEASVALLRLDGRPIAGQVVLYCGPMAYTWKTAFDVAYAKYSPGMLLIDKLTEQLFASGPVHGIDSCSAAGSFMGQLWAGRRAMTGMLLETGPRPSLAFMAEALRRSGYVKLKALRDRLRAAKVLSAPRRNVAPR